MRDYTPIIGIRPDVVYIPPENFESPELKIVFPKEGPLKFCPHDQIKIYPHHRLIQCAACGAVLDPFDHLVSVGRKENNQLSNIAFLKTQVKHWENKVEALKKEVIKLRKERNKLEGS